MTARERDSNGGATAREREIQLAVRRRERERFNWRCDGARLGEFESGSVSTGQVACCVFGFLF